MWVINLCNSSNYTVLSYTIFYYALYSALFVTAQTTGGVFEV